MSATLHYRLDDLRRFTSALASGVGVPAARASVLAARLLWFDAAGAARFGIASLPVLIERISAGELDPKTDGGIVSEKSGTATWDGGGGIPLLVLDRVAGLATEKARETGVGLVRVENLAPLGPTAGIAAEMTVVGPYAGLVLGPGTSWSLALPTEGGLPVVFDPALTAIDGPKSRQGRDLSAPSAVLGIPLASWLAPAGGCLVAALSIPALEAFSVFHERLAAALGAMREESGRLLPGPWEGRRRAAQSDGVPVEPALWASLSDLASRLSVVLPEPLRRSSRPA